MSSRESPIPSDEHGSQQSRHERRVHLNQGLHLPFILYVFAWAAILLFFTESEHPALGHGDHSPAVHDSLSIAPGDSLLAGLTKGEEFPFEVTIRATGQRLKLHALGSGVRHWQDEVLYEAVLYVDASAALGDDPFGEIVHAGFARRMLLRFHRDLSAQELQREFGEALAESEASEGERAYFMSYFEEGVREGETADLIYVPALGFYTLVADHWHPTIRDKELADSVFGMWLGEEPLSGSLKEDLLRFRAKDR